MKIPVLEYDLLQEWTSSGKCYSDYFFLAPLLTFPTLVFLFCLRYHGIPAQAVDLYVLERAFISTHEDSEPLVNEVMRTYKVVACTLVGCRQKACFCLLDHPSFAQTKFSFVAVAVIQPFRTPCSVCSPALLRSLPLSRLSPPLSETENTVTR